MGGTAVFAGCGAWSTCFLVRLLLLGLGRGEATRGGGVAVLWGVISSGIGGVGIDCWEAFRFSGGRQLEPDPCINRRMGLTVIESYGSSLYDGGRGRMLPSVSGPIVLGMAGPASRGR